MKRKTSPIIPVVTWIIILAALAPVLWMLLISFKQRVDIISFSVLFKPTLENYKTVFQKYDFLRFILNSTIVVVATTAISVFLGTLAAYGLARFQFKKKESLAFGILSLRMLPPMAVVIPFFIMARYTHLLDTQLLLIIVYLGFNIPFTIWMMRGFIEDVSLSIEESAWLDGCTRLEGFCKVVFPSIFPGLAATSIFCFIQSWNEFALAFFLTSFNSRTVPTIVNSFISVLGVLWGEMAAVGVVSILPIVIFTMFVQKYLVKGLTMGAIKG
ncbi:carbohydrate ABC transporter permease [Sediminispirochaeta smaragdinae]|jgi:multiple sugar transport system permease protein|uniref:Maltose/maltodextrin transport system permease protein MalG n=1 Tax=Sediminispirochaeta smaragdinae (strain DSM 11293 / JCM 15392 / SEBR 4228) TaxID=573413 RepID=E1RB02_SEDSS|nr:carbohydrate ABC transporter permease [Sediminispirochaeta smaragdinae]ADK79532.1 binding-protein-dependent transport systems inner membrane component [Sediminispirochaeta smaragdinae DSM 11293]